MLNLIKLVTYAQDFSDVCSRRLVNETKQLFTCDCLRDVNYILDKIRKE